MGATALSAVTGVAIQMYFPPLASSFEHQPLTRLVIGRGIRSKRAGMVIMWSSCSDVPVSGSVTMNHFVPLIPNHKPVAGEAIVVADAAPTRVTSADDIGNDASRSPLRDDAAVLDDGSDEDECPPAKVTTFATDTGSIGNGNSITSGTNPPSDGERQFSGGHYFKSNADVITMLRSATDVLPHVPRGRKVDCCFVVNNTANVDRKAAHQKNRFWDDCGVWDTKQGRNLTVVYMRNPHTGVLNLVNLREGVVCTKKRQAGKVRWNPVDPQPPEDDLITLCHYYASLKSLPTYRKRVTWLANQPERVLIEYIGAIY